MRILFITTEHEEGTTEARRELYETAQARIASVVGEPVDAMGYWDVEAPTADALILSGSYDPWAKHSPAILDRFSDVLRRYEGPVLGICAGMQMLVRAEGGTIGPAQRATRGFATVEVLDDADLLAGAPPSFGVYQSHDDEVTLLPRGFRVLATSATCAIEAIAADDRPWWGTQFHPEAFDLEHPVGRTILERFLDLARGEIAARGDRA